MALPDSFTADIGRGCIEAGIIVLDYFAPGLGRIQVLSVEATFIVFERREGKAATEEHILNYWKENKPQDVVSICIDLVEQRSVSSSEDNVSSRMYSDRNLLSQGIWSRYLNVDQAGASDIVINCSYQVNETSCSSICPDADESGLTLSLEPCRNSTEHVATLTEELVLDGGSTTSSVNPRLDASEDPTDSPSDKPSSTPSVEPTESPSAKPSATRGQPNGTPITGDPISQPSSVPSGITSS